MQATFISSTPPNAPYKPRLEHLLSAARTDLEEAQAENRELLEAARSKRTKKKKSAHKGAGAASKARSPSLSPRSPLPTSAPTTLSGAAPADSNRRPQSREIGAGSARRPSVAVSRSGSVASSRRGSMVSSTGEQATPSASSNRSRVGSVAPSSPAPNLDGSARATLSSRAASAPVPGGEERKASGAPRAGASEEKAIVRSDSPTGGHAEEQQQGVATATAAAGREKGGGGGAGGGDHDANNRKRRSRSPSMLGGGGGNDVVVPPPATNSPRDRGSSSSGGRQTGRSGAGAGAEGQGDDGGDNAGESRQQEHRSGESGQQQTSPEETSQRWNSSEVSKHPASGRAGRRSTKVGFSSSSPSRPRGELAAAPDTLGGETGTSSMPMEGEREKRKRGFAVSVGESAEEICRGPGDRMLSEVLSRSSSEGDCCWMYRWLRGAMIMFVICSRWSYLVGARRVHVVYGVSFRSDFLPPAPFTPPIRR